MPMSFVAQPVMQKPVRPREYGSIATLRCIPLTKNGNGKSFITVNVVKHGGPGVAIAPLPILVSKKNPEHSSRYC